MRKKERTASNMTTLLADCLLMTDEEYIRIREEPLKRIFDTDIISKKPYNGKEITDNLLKPIMTTYKLDKKQSLRLRNIC